ncbi:hypothetical protein ACED16_05125 [Enterobacter hormaechei]
MVELVQNGMFRRSLLSSERVDAQSAAAT